MLGAPRLRKLCAAPPPPHEGSRPPPQPCPASTTIGWTGCQAVSPILGDEDGLKECEACVQEWRCRAAHAGFTSSVTRMKSLGEEAGKERSTVALSEISAEPPLCQSAPAPPTSSFGVRSKNHCPRLWKSTSIELTCDMPMSITPYERVGGLATCRGVQGKLGTRQHAGMAQRAHAAVWLFRWPGRAVWR